MVEIDTGVPLQIKHSTSGGYLEIHMPLAGEPSEVWRGLLTSLAEGQQITLLDADARSWVRVVLHGDIEDAGSISRRLAEVVPLIERVNRRQVELEERWSPLDDDLQSWWADLR